MNRPTTLAVAVSCCSLLALAGCAGSPTRVASDSASSPGPHPAYEAAPSEGVSVSDEIVIGHAFDDGSVPVYHEPVSRYTMEQIRAELEAMYDLDQQLVRASVDPEAHNPDTVHLVRAIDRAHCDRLREIVDHIGWPRRDLVGLKATQAAYMVIQHAGHDIDFQNRCLGMMVDLVEQGELPASYVALLTDRIRVFQDRPQLFGTQMAMARDESGMMVPTPVVTIEDPENLDQRRKLMGMGPHAEFVNAIELAYEASRKDPGTAYAEVLLDE